MPYITVGAILTALLVVIVRWIAEVLGAIVNVIL